MASLYAPVRYGAMDLVRQFSTSSGDLHAGAGVIVRTERGMEWGVVVASPREAATPELTGEIVRQTTPEDHRRQEDIVEQKEKEEFDYCKELIKEHRMPMKLIRVEHLFGGHRIVFYFLADGRVDFRELVKDLAKRYRARIEMHQIGVRDEARLLGAVGGCGRELCCRSFLRDLKPIPMKVAKSQKSTLDPAKISGRCGRLKCCLRFEEGLYSELKEALPRRGTKVETAFGIGAVVGYQIVEQTVKVKFEDGVERTLQVEEIKNHSASEH